MTLLQLKYIVKIVECGSMNEASHALYVSQPALSSSVKELENELGIEIFTRSSQGIALTVDGAEFLTYARQVLDQADLLEERYKHAKPRKQLCQVSTQHYMFAVEAFVEMINSIKSDEYEFTIRETRTRDIINQVANMQSEIGIIYLSDFNKDVIGKLLREKHLEFHPLFRAPRPEDDLGCFAITKVTTARIASRMRISVSRNLPKPPFFFFLGTGWGSGSPPRPW